MEVKEDLIPKSHLGRLTAEKWKTSPNQSGNDMVTMTTTKTATTATAVAVAVAVAGEEEQQQPMERYTTAGTASSSTTSQESYHTSSSLQVLENQVKTNTTTTTRRTQWQRQQQQQDQPPPRQVSVEEGLAAATTTVTRTTTASPPATRTTRRVHETDPSTTTTTSPTTRISLCGYLWRRHKLSLSRAPTTPYCITFLVPLLSILTHVIFYYGQTQPMWHLHLSQQVDLWANATTYESRTAFRTLGLPYQNLITTHKEQQVKTFSYWYAIQELWKAKHMPGKILPRTAAILLVIFSGIWPHLKLILLNCTWLLSIHQQRRTRILTWLSTLGKWSLADVLVVCVMVGVLHLDWIVDPQAIRTGLLDNMSFFLRVIKSLYSASDICTILLKNIDCHIHHKSWKKWSECKGCVGLIKTALDYPDQARHTFKGVLDGIYMSGGGHVTLRVLGLHGIYAFCAAVILSILISLLVDILDGKAHRAEMRWRYRLGQRLQLQRRRQQGQWLLAPNGGGSIDDDDDDGEDNNQQQLNDDNDDDNDYHHQDEYYDSRELLLPGDMVSGTNHIIVGQNDMEQGGGDDDDDDENAYYELIQSTQRRRSWSQMFYSAVQSCAVLILCLVTIGAVGIGIGSNTIERNVHGAIPDVLRDILGIVWNRSYSLWTLVQTTGAAGGMDFMLMFTFGLFVIFGPASRALLCFLAWMVPLQGRKRRKLLASIELVGAFCAWEVFAVAVGMVDMLMPAITSTVVMKPEVCSTISDDDGTCLQVNFDLQKSFALWVVGGGLLLIAVSNLIFGASGRRPQQAPQSLSSFPNTGTTQQNLNN